MGAPLCSGSQPGTRGQCSMRLYTPAPPSDLRWPVVWGTTPGLKWGSPSPSQQQNRGLLVEKEEARRVWNSVSLVWRAGDLCASSP